MLKLFHEFKSRKIGQTLVLYLGSAWVVIEALNFFIEKYQIKLTPPGVTAS